VTESPLVSCLMVTRGDLFPARFAIHCYLRQTYRPRELVVLCDRPAAELRAHIDTLGDPSIRFVEAEPGPLGELRNASLAAARGELVAQWDDDDLYHPRRLELQAGGLAGNAHAAAHFLSRWLLWWPARRLLAMSGRRLWEGSMVARRALLPAYPPLGLEEDSALVLALFHAHPCIESDVPALYCYVVHGGNAWDEAHFEEMFGRATRRFEGDEYSALLAQLAEALPVLEYEQARTRA
jgi:glycosyltransferase involved in cell wall biosynthesis